MKRILLALFFGYVFGAVVFGQQQGGVAFQPIINFEDILGFLMGLVVQIFKECWLMLFSIFFAWLAFQYLKSCLDGKDRAATIKREGRIQQAVDREMEREYARISRRDTREAVMEYCRDDYDRLLLALARFGGLRIPSEIRLMRFSDFTKDVILIHKDTKTGAREVPLLGEIREIFDRIVVNLGKDFEPSDLVFGNVSSFSSFQHRFVQTIHRSGVEQWTKLFVNLRSSCITDFVERGYKEKTLDAIFGNSAMVRSRHYVQFRKDKEYAKVLKDDAKLLTLLREGADENDIFSLDIDELLVLRDLLVNRFGTGKIAS